MKQAGSAGFRAIAGYIFGGNTRAGGASSSGKGESIAMTSPVRMEIQSGSASSSSSSGKKGESIAMT
jgi:hypothetical protein